MREKRWLLLALFGFLLINAITDALKATRPKFKIATTSTTTTTEESRLEENENEDAVTTTPATNSSEGNVTTGHTLTGIPQIDYIWDPNLPRELNGYNLSDYPFYNSIPEDIDFKCDGLHDGFYASVPHKCQVYHHCLFGTRYDFLCANFTAFDQKTFICHFVSEVDCANSKKYWHRNDALYKATTSSTTSTSTTTTTTVAPVTVASSSNGRGSSRERDPLRRRRPYSRRRPYDYYDEDYYDDEYTRPRGYDRRDDYEYEDRKYRRDRDRDVRDRDRDFRDRDTTRSRDTTIRDERDRDVSPRERYPSRNNRRDQARPRDPPEEDARGLKNREQEQSRSREIEDSELDDRRIDSRGRDNDDRRYSDKRFRDDYDDKDSAAALSNQGSIGGTEGLVKPAAPISSVYSRPRAPPKIRRPVPLSEQDRYAYKSTSAQSTEPRRRPVDLEDDYYDDELEDIRPMRRPLRRRPTYRERDRDRDFYDVRDRERDRPFRTRYREDEDDIRPRKHPDRSRDRYYERERERDRSLERGRDRSVDRGKDLSAPRSLDRDRGRYQDTERPYSSSRPLERERDNRPVIDDRSRSSFRSKDLSDTTETSRRPISTTSTTCMPEMPVHEVEPETKQTSVDRFERPERPTRPLQSYNNNNNNNNNNGARGSLEDEEEDLGKKSIKTPHYTTYQERDQEEEEEQDHRYSQQQQQQQQQQHHASSYSDEYSSEYYDEPEDPPIPPPRTTVRVVKRPFLPSRGGVPNPRGLSPVGSKAPRREEDRSTERTSLQQQHQHQHEENHKDYYAQQVPDQESKRIDQDGKREEEKQTYDAYKVIQSDLQQKQRQEEYDMSIARPILRRPVERQREEEETKSLEQNPIPKSATTESYEETRKTLESDVPTSNKKWSTEQFTSNKENNDGIVPTSSGSPIRSKSRQPVTEISNLYSSTYKAEDIHEQPSGPSSFRVKQRINEVTHKLQDIPDSEYDVTLNDALTPTLTQEANLPSGFVLPLHRQLGRDTVLQSSEDNYKISRPIAQQQQQKPFVPSPQFVPAPAVPNERQRTVYYRTPEPISYNGQHYRQQSQPWQDYTGY
uniref:zinc finger CCCH domain-containing protein 13 isoform X2 n=1 Tax=Vespula vulgaris TaxID=7454 RepID=UPI00223BC648|nr:zinc finger CCCH domain-containing protein 13 isoform X2 [Vespula vulgaris]